MRCHIFGESCSKLVLLGDFNKKTFFGFNSINTPLLVIACSVIEALLPVIRRKSGHAWGFDFLISVTSQHPIGDHLSFFRSEFNWPRSPKFTRWRLVKQDEKEVRRLDEAGVQHLINLALCVQVGEKGCGKPSGNDASTKDDHQTSAE
ncbi:MAG: hypothetical protein OQJ97_14425 [Rhodospirillales bacterium]|nr:hypothetical protein [Rhodospirillales bacterium]